MFDEADKRRFEKFLRRDPETGCLVFTGALNQGGYGVFSVRHPTRPGRYINTYAHRIAFQLAGGQLSDEKPCVLHSCDNRACCDVAHLRAGTMTDNMADRGSRNRTWSKLSRAAREEIKRSNDAADDLAARYGVSANHIRNLQREHRGLTVLLGLVQAARAAIARGDCDAADANMNEVETRLREEIG